MFINAYIVLTFHKNRFPKKVNFPKSCFKKRFQNNETDPDLIGRNINVDHNQGVEVCSGAYSLNLFRGTSVSERFGTSFT